MIIIPVFQNISSRFSFDIQLGDDLFHLKFAWNAREEAWYMDIQDQDQNNILTNVKMVVNYLLLNQYRAYSELPEGNFLLWDLEKKPGEEVTFDNFGKRYQLLFLTDSEIQTGEISGI